VNPERWRHIERLYHSALERPSLEREAFLESECRGDDDLRLEVQALLTRAASAENFLDAPAAAVAAQMVSQPASPILTGLRLGAYVVQAPLGAGGMGVVYRALDTKLNRSVAIKFLSDDLADPAARRRFQREAQTASSLNHPHILTVHDAGEFEGRQYLVTEFVDGGTLRDWARAATRGWRQTIELLTGVADGLAAAHQAGILHRDIKPENILIAKSGYAKLADFGLAKLHEGVASDDATRAVTETRTRQGLIVGTVAYMSPEQASGQPLDVRSDIFSFGVVLYEALAGQRPFAGASDVDVLAAIIHRPAAPLPDGVPLPLRMAVEKALEKDPADRFQSMRDMVVDLRRVARQSADSPPALPAMRRATRARRWLAAGAAVVVILAAAGALWVLRFRQPAAPARSQYTQLTNFADSATSPALSPDGRMLTFIRGESTLFGPGQIYVKLLPDGEPVQLTRDSLEKMGPKFSPDGARIAYSTVADGGATLDTWIVPVLGGQPRLLLTNAEGLRWIPPRVLYSEMTGRGYQMSIVSSTESRTEHRNVYMPPENGMAHRSNPSPDRKQVLVVEMGNEGGRGGYGWLPCRLAPFDGSSSGKPVGPAPAQCTDAAWSPDGKWMYFSANTGGGFHVWRQRFPDGMPEQVTFGATEEEGIEFAPDGRSFVTSIGTSQSTVWMHDSRGDRQITSEGYALLPSVSPDGKKLYYLVRTGGARNFAIGELWVADLESGQRQRLLPDFRMQHYTISADGQRVLFVAADDAGHTPLWLAPLNGRTAPQRLTTIDSWVAYFGAPGEVVFASEGDFIYRIKDDGSDLQKMLPAPNLALFAISPDGQWASAEAANLYGDSMAYPAGGGAPTLICRGCSPPQGTEIVPPRLSWTPDGKFLYLKFDASTYAIPLQPGRMLPPVPASGFQSKDAVAALPGARLISEDSGVFPGPNPSVYALMKVATQRNIYRVPVP
jgi:Tol biopolymer transport system component